MLPMYIIYEDRLSIRDLMTLTKAGSARDMESILPLLEKCVATDDGRKVEDLPAKHLSVIIDALTKKLSGTDSGN